MIRRRCKKRGHDWMVPWGSWGPTPRVCARWFCTADEGSDQ